MYVYQQGKLIRKSIFNDTNKYSLYPFDAFTTFAINHEIIRNYSFDIRFFNSEDMHLLIRIAGKYPIQVIPKYTNIYHYNPNNSGGLDSDYNTIHQNKIKVFNSLLHPDNILKTHYLKRKLCLSHILILSGDFKYNIKNIMISAFNNFICFFSYPIEFIKLLCRIVYVKILEKINLKSFDDRF